MEKEPGSILTVERPDIWRRSLDLAAGLTGYQFPAKLPLSDGTIYACYGSYTVYVPPKVKTPEEIRQERIIDIDNDIAWHKRQIESEDERIKEINKRRKEHEKAIEKLENEKAKLVTAPSVFVPEGAMEWLLHEVGHWVASNPEERQLPNYGYDTFQKGSGHGDAREWQAWAFEEIILAPFGQSRSFAAPSYRGGTAFRKAESIPNSAFIHIAERMNNQRICVDQFRGLWGEWIAWGQTRGPEAPWLT